MQDASNLPGNAAGQFSDGNPATSVGGTQLLSIFMNDLMNNVLQVITDAGTGISDGDDSDLVDAINQLITDDIDDLDLDDIEDGSGRRAIDDSVDTAFAAGRKIVWDGDTNLYRSAANTLKTDGHLQALSVQVERISDSTFIAREIGDSAPRWYAHSSGALVWGDGAGTNDTNLYRSAVNTLKTDDNLIVGIDLTVIGGTINIGADVTLERTAADVLTIDDTVIITNELRITNRIQADWSDGGSANGITWGSAEDTNLWRSAANTLRTDSKFEINNELWLGDSETLDVRLYRSAPDTLTIDDLTTFTNGATILSGQTIAFPDFVGPDASNGGLMGGSGGFMWIDGSTNGTTEVTLETRLNWRDRYIVIIAFLFEGVNRLPGEANDATILGFQFTDPTGSGTDMRGGKMPETIFYSRAGGASVAGNIKDNGVGGAGDIVLIYADSSTGDLKLKKDTDTGDEYDFAFLVIFSEDQGEY